jgi:hypothetical protein
MVSAASFVSQEGLGAAAVTAAGLQPPSAAAVLRHSSSAGELFVSAGIPGEWVGCDITCADRPWQSDYVLVASLKVVCASTYKHFDEA